MTREQLESAYPRGSWVEFGPAYLGSGRYAPDGVSAGRWHVVGYVPGSDLKVARQPGAP